MWGPFREFLIADHQFYVTEAKRRLLDQFTDESIKADSDRFEREWLANRSSFFDPDRDDEGAIYEQAWDESIAFYERLDRSEEHKTELQSLMRHSYAVFCL